jgi:hypothetical protein
VDFCVMVQLQSLRSHHNFAFGLLVRKIIHVDMDAFYASIEQRDKPDLRGKPVIAAWNAKRSVVCAASGRLQGAIGERDKFDSGYLGARVICPKW